MSVTLYGIKNCDTIKKARKWLEQNAIDYRFHDFRADGLDKRLLGKWVKRVDWQVLLNTRGTTWRKLPESQKQGMDQNKALALMLEQPALIKRPVLALDEDIHIGFKDETYTGIFS